MKYIFAVAVLISSVFAAKLPKGMIRCKWGDTECYGKAIEAGAKVVANGIPELGVPSGDPLVIPELTVGAGGNAVQLDQKYRNMKTYGFSTIKVKQINYSNQTERLTLDFSTGDQYMTANYDFNGKVLVIPIVGNGTCRIDQTKPQGTLSFKVNLYMKNNKHYLRASDGDLKITCEHAKYQFDNLFNGNQQLSKNIHDVVNENWKAVYDDVIEGYCKGYIVAIQDVINKLLGKIPTSEMFYN